MEFFIPMLFVVFVGALCFCAYDIGRRAGREGLERELEDGPEQPAAAQVVDYAQVRAVVNQEIRDALDRRLPNDHQIATAVASRLTGHFDELMSINRGGSPIEKLWGAIKVKLYAIENAITNADQKRAERTEKKRKAKRKRK